MLRGVAVSVLVAAEIFSVTAQPGSDALQHALVTSNYVFSEPSQSLALMLEAIRRQTGIQYFYRDPQVGHLIVPALAGSMTIEEALVQLLDGTGYEFSFTDDRTIVISRHAQPQPAATDQKVVYHPEGASAAAIYEVLVSAPRTTALGFKKISPTTVLEGQYLVDLGITNLASALYDTPAVTASRSAENTVYTGGPSVNMLDLRDLGVVRTLVVVNGRRHVPTNGGTADFIAVDMNVLPAGLVERVEVLTTGASVLYGADAVGGLVNVTLKDDYEGLDIAVLGNMSERGDNGHYNLSASFGHKFAGGDGYYMAFTNIHRYDGLKARDRYISSDPAWFALNGYPTSAEGGGLLTRGFGRAPASQNGTATGYALANGSFRNFEDETWIAIGDNGLPAGDYEGFPDQRFNWAAHSDLAAPIDTFVYSGNLLYDLDDEHRLFFEHTLARSVVDRELAPTPTYVAGQQGIFIPIDNPFIPEDIRGEIRAEVGDDVSGVFINRRISEVGNRTYKVTRDLIRLAVGAEGTLGNTWDYSAYYQFGMSDSVIRGTNAVDFQKIAISATPELCAAAAADGCTLTNYFGLNSITNAQADYLRTTYRNRNRISQHILAAEARGPLWQLPAGKQSVVVGLGYRREMSDTLPDPLVQQGRIGGIGFSHALRGAYDVVEAHIATSMPVLDKAPLAYGFTLDAGLRYSYFSTVGHIVSWQVGGEYRPTESLSIRASYQEANRAPNLSELYTPATSERNYYNDPCNELELGYQSATVAANCRSDGMYGGVEDGFFQRSVYADGQFSGNGNLMEEQARTRNIGITFKPHLPDRYGDLYVSLDWFDIEVDNFIRGRTLQFIIDACYRSENLSGFFCGDNPANGAPFFARDPETGEIADVNLALQNSGTFTARGIDTELIYSQRLGNLGLPDSWGDIRLRVLHSYNLESKLGSANGAAEEVFRGSITRPIHKLLASLTYNNGPLLVDWSVRYRSRGIANTLVDADVDGNLAPSIAYHNLAVRYGLNDRITVQGGIENLFDTDPPFLAFAVHNTFAEYYDVVGRRFYLGFRVKF